MKKVKFLIVVSLLLLITLNVSSQEIEKDTIISLDEIVITGTRTKRSLKEVPNRISIIGSKIIDLSPAQQIDDILRYTSGVNVNRSTGLYSQRPMVTLRGLSGDEQSRTLVMINSVPINTSDEGGVNWNRINQYDIERIEVFKGPGSSLYGNNAMGGVINIITKKSKKPKEIQGGVSYGTFNTVRQDLNVRLRNEKNYYGSISQYYLKSDGYNNLLESKRTKYDTARELEEVSLSVKAGNDNNRWFNWELQYDIYRDRRGEGYKIYVPKGNYRNFNTNLFRGNLKGKDGTTKYDFNVFYQIENYLDINERIRRGNYSRFDVNSYREDMGAIFNISRKIGKNNTLTAGFEYKNGSVDGGDYYQTPRTTKAGNKVYDIIKNGGKISTLAAYVQDEQSFYNNKIRLILGLRFDNVTFYDGKFSSTNPWNTMPELKENKWSELSPRIGVRFNPNKNLSTYISYSHGFRSSILDDLTRTGWMWVGPKYANPELGPESLDNFEIGVDLFPSKDFKISTSAYYSKGKDFLYYVATSDKMFGRPIYRRENVTNVNLKGFETDIEYDVTENLKLLSSYTFAHSKINKFPDRPELENKYLKYVPKHSASASLLWNNKYINTSIRGFYKGKQYGDDLNKKVLDSYVTFDLKLSKQIKENYVLSLDIQDIFDNKHMATIDYLSPGRLITVRAAIKL